MFVYTAEWLTQAISQPRQHNFLTARVQINTVTMVIALHFLSEERMLGCQIANSCLTHPIRIQDLSPRALPIYFVCSAFRRSMFHVYQRVDDFKLIFFYFAYYSHSASILSYNSILEK